MWFCDFAKKTQRSIRYAFGDIKDILPILKERNQKYFAISDYGDISVWPSQFFKCKNNGVIPILGMETFINNYRIDGKDGEITIHKISYDEEWDKSIKEIDDIEKDLVTMDFSIDLFALTIDGYYNIIQIHNDAQINGMEKRPRTTDKFISKHGKGILALLPNPYNDVCSLVYNGLYNDAKKRFEFYKQTFDKVIVSIPILEDKSCQEINDIMIKFCLENDIEMMPVINSHYNFKDDEEVFKTFRKISKIRGGMTFDVDLCEGMTYKTKEEVIETYRKFHKSEIFTEEVLDKLFKTYETVLQNFKVLDIDVTPKMPKFPDGDKILRRKAWEGLVKKGLDKKRNYVERLEYELDNVINAGFADYFLFLEDLYSWYISKGRYPSSGRGSGAGSLVLYCLGIMNVDPIKYNLLFERFLDASRLQAIIEKGEKVTAEQFPDVDCDFPGEEKDNVREYFISKYGKNNVCHIGTVGLLKLRGTLKELARLYDISPDEINELTTNGMKDLDKDDEGLSIEELRNKCVALNEFLNKYPEFEKVFDKLYGTINCWGIHAGGMIVTDFDLTKQMPIRVVDDKYVSCWTEGLGGRELGQMGFIKMDILAIDCLDTLEKTIKLINKRHDEHFDLYNIPVDEKESIDQLNKHDSIGIFQFDSPVATRVIDNIGGVETFEDLSVVNSLARPASLVNNFDKVYGELRKNSEEVFIPEELQKSMKDTLGLPIYQEAAYFYAKDLAGFDKVDSYVMMKKLYKNKLHTKEDIDYWKNKFVEGCKDKIKREVIEVKFEDGSKKTFELDEMILCKDGEYRKIEEIIEKNIEI